MAVGSSSDTGDIPPILALMGLGAVMGGYFYLESPAIFLQLYSSADHWIGEHTEFLSVVLFCTAINVIWAYSLLTRAFGLNRQGGRLEVLTGKRQEAILPPLRVIGASALFSIIAFTLMTTTDIPDAHELASLILKDPILKNVLLWLRLNFSLTAFIVALIAARLSLWRLISRSFMKGLPKFPKIENGIVLGSIGEDNPRSNPTWSVLTRRALNGNVLITGSIGGGKTQGTILPYLDQVLANFKVRPSLLLIDPKGTFIPEAKKIIAKHGLSEHVLHMKLGGAVTFNPIFTKDPLKDAHFLDTAQMIRAAAVNFMGKSFDSAFWEIAAFNLIKNSIVLCAARYHQEQVTA